MKDLDEVFALYLIVEVQITFQNQCPTEELFAFLGNAQNVSFSFHCNFIIAAKEAPGICWERYNLATSKYGTCDATKHHPCPKK